MLTLGIDTSNYTTSCALYNSETGEVIQKKLLLPVKEPDDGVVILKFEEADGEEILVGVEDDEEAQAVLDLYNSSIEE